MELRKGGRLVALALAGFAVAVLGRRALASGPRSTESPLINAYIKVAQRLDRTIGWDKLPLPLGLFTVIGNRFLLRQQNLHDTSSIPSTEPRVPAPPDSRYLSARTTDGTYNDLGHPEMGKAGARFGRNVPLAETYPDRDEDILRPSPRVVSRELLTRHEFKPATTINVLAAAWIQFMVRDWLSHGRGDIEHPWSIPLADDDPWGGAGRERPMIIPRTASDYTRQSDSSGAPPTFINTETHWWDGSQLYGSDLQAQRQRRTGQDGKLALDRDGMIPAEFQKELAQHPGWWIGLAMFQTIFAREHNAICDRLKDEFPSWSDDDIFDHARLVNAALLAKIHTTEWTPAIISHPTTQYALRANWWGIEMERLHRLFGRLSDSEVLSGIPGSSTDHHGAPYAITEEFVAVYRLHPLIPDQYVFQSSQNDSVIERREFGEVTDRYVMDILDRVSLTDLFYSFGIANPGEVTLRNYPRGLQEFRRPDGKFMDLGATDILRTRELGVPRYNRFRRLFHLPPAGSFEELAGDTGLADELRRVYDDDIEKVDLMVGLFAEKKPQGFGFSDTAFRVFILMASRRLKSDRFFTVDYTPAVYSQAGLDWIDNNTMLTVLQRHCPGLIPRLRDAENAFAPWPRAAVA